MGTVATLTLAGTGGLAVVLGLCFLAFLTLAVMLVGARDRIRREQRLAQMVATSGRRDESDPPARPDRVPGNWLKDGVVETTERLVQAGGMAAGLERRLERAGWPVRVGELVAGSVGAAFAGAVVGALFLQSLLFTLVLAAAGAAVPPALVEVASRKRAKRLAQQLGDTLMILATSLRSGHSLLQSLDLVAKEIGEPANTEFNRVLAEIRLGRPPHEALESMADRIGSDDLRWAVLAINIQREVGGNLAEILETVAQTVRQRETIRRQVQVLSAEGRLSAGILTALPFLVGLYIAKMNPGYLTLLFHTRLGLIMLMVAACLLVLGGLWMRKVVRIDV